MICEDSDWNIIVESNDIPVKQLDNKCKQSKDNEDYQLLDKCMKIITSIKNNNMDTPEINNLNEINEIVLRLALKNGQKIKDKNHKNKLGMSRNSYNFCNRGFYCSKKFCKSHHFVYNLLYDDISELINYLKNGGDDSDQIRISINTINYVIKHMYDELSKS